MNVLFSVRIPVETSLALRSKLGALIAAHQRQVKKEGGKGGVELAKKLTMNNLVRVALIASVEKLSNEELLDLIADKGLTVGRPRDVAA